jgi:ABC-type uncharacterized transport system substrate-binding protein
MRLSNALLIAICPCLPSLPVGAHPHVFVDTTLQVKISAESQLEGVEISWTYDDFYSLLLIADEGLDPDGDGRLSDTEMARLDGFDMQWIDGFQGDTFATLNGSAVILGPPQPLGTSVENGLVTTRHFRAASGPADGLVIKAFDPTFYTAYSLVGPVTVEGPCTINFEPADLDAAYTLVEELLYAIPAAQAEAEYPEVGEAFADSVTLACAP